MLIGENQDETITKIESCDMTFFKCDFSSREEIKREEPLFKLYYKVVLDGSAELQEETLSHVDQIGSSLSPNERHIRAFTL